MCILAPQHSRRNQLRYGSQRQDTGILLDHPPPPAQQSGHRQQQHRCTRYATNYRSHKRADWSSSSGSS
ncbi:hypothetical protein HXX76_008485 [Chlamydomonas incerta]|uniref:Uncharacterized protein n=1 Tax=Chlamydomonas incerta TaxID=51695 RepID=A0A835SXS1_CHLIN|nr:hypothetical protein HXX76_008485 [Chlamydomonas incerta]|eukprot:KAG2433427.1 hypothetical protein HXX76_008485 [Chlamydomonas incerta]